MISWPLAVDESRLRAAIFASVGVGVLVLTGAAIGAMNSSILTVIGGAAGLAVVAVSSAISPRLAVALVFAASTLSGVLIPTQAGILRLDQAIVLPAICGVLLRWAADRGRHSQTTNPAPPLLAIFLGIFILVNLGSTVMLAIDVASSIRVVLWLSLSYAAYLLTMIAVPRYASVDKVLDDLIAVGTIAAGAALVLGLLSEFGMAPFAVQADPTTGQLSVKGLFFEANLLGSFAAMMTLLVGSRLLHQSLRTRLPQVWLWVSLFICGAATYVSLTRAAWLGLAAGGAVLLLVRQPASGRTRIILKASLILGAVTAVLLVFGGATFADRLASLLTDSTRTIAYRSATIDTALAGMKDHFLFGYGTNSFGQHHLDPTQDYAPWYLAGLIVATLWDTGLLGLGTLLLAFGILTRRIWRGIGSDDASDRSLAVGFAAACVAGAIAFQATNGFWFAYVWILMSVAASVPIQGRSAGLYRSAAPSRRRGEAEPSMIVTRSP